jgi:hypothetical protein
MKKREKNRLDLVLYSRGGDSDVPWSIVSMFREYSEKGSFSVLIPYRAHSAATVMCLGADEIVMTKKAELGPIDITIVTGPYNPTEGNSLQRLPVSVEDVMGYFTFLEKIQCSRQEENMRAFEQLTARIHPLVIGHVNRLLEQTKLVAKRLLGTRAKPFPDEKNEGVVKRLSSEIYSHGHTINRTEAIQQLEMSQVVKAEDIAIDEELWGLYEEYRTMFLMEKPFMPDEHLVAQDLEDYTWKGLGLACVESENRLDVCTQDLRVRRIRQVPPQVQLNLSMNNLQIPPMNIPQIPDPKQIQAIVGQALNNMMQSLISDAANRAVEALVRSLPIAGFEHLVFNVGWRRR